MPVDDLNGIYIQETEANAIAMRMRVLGEEAGAIHLDAGKRASRIPEQCGKHLLR